MVFSSPVFLFMFLPATVLLYHLPIFKSIQYKNILLLIASLLFYAWGEPVFVFVMLLSIFINWIAGLLIPRYGKAAMLSAVIFDVGLLFVCKYLTFVLKTIFNPTGMQSVAFSISLPIGISFFTFQIISYVVDVYRKQAPIQRNPVNLALYISMFPQLIAGPIVRYASIDEQLQKRTTSSADVAYGIRRFTVGLGKKLLIANYMGIVADNLFGMTGQLSTMAAWYGVICYAFQIYFDFSGYSDMAIGLGRIFGFHFEENFRYPYTAKSVVDFWRRWHISLSTWFRDYVYIPLGGNRVSKYRWLLNYFIVWMLTGIWHGANWTFFLWGFYYFTLLTLEKLTGIQQKLRRGYRFATLLFILLGWVLFRSDSLYMAQQYLRSMFTVSAHGFTDFVFFQQLGTSYPVLILAAVGSTPLCKMLFERLKMKDALKQCLLFASTVLLFLLSLLVSISSTHNPFLYFNF